MNKHSESLRVYAPQVATIHAHFGASLMCAADEIDRLEERIAELTRERDTARMQASVHAEQHARAVEQRDEAKQETKRFKYASDQHLGFQKRLERERDAAVDALKHIMDIQETAKLAHMRHRTAELEKENAMLREADEEDSACGQAAIDRIATLEKAVKDALKAYPLAMAMRDALTREALPNESEALSSGCALSRGGFKCDS